MDENREEIRKEQQNLESLENSEALQSEIGKTKARIRILEGEHAKARAKYEKSFPEKKMNPIWKKIFKSLKMKK